MTFVTVTDGISAVLGTFMAGVLIAWLGINWITGCGEVTRTMNGAYVNGECVFVPWADANPYEQLTQ